jgi:hypothetical protein
LQHQLTPERFEQLLESQFVVVNPGQEEFQYLHVIDGKLTELPAGPEDTVH